jgi:hypothetical protein
MLSGRGFPPAQSALEESTLAVATSSPAGVPLVLAQIGSDPQNGLPGVFVC